MILKPLDMEDQVVPSIYHTLYYTILLGQHRRDYQLLGTRSLVLYEEDSTGRMLHKLFFLINRCSIDKVVEIYRTNIGQLKWFSELC